VTKYIQAESGAAFEICCTLSRPFPAMALSVCINMDGKPVHGFLCEQSTYKGLTVPYKLAGVSHTDPSGKTFLSKFCFSSLTVGMCQLLNDCTGYSRFMQTTQISVQLATD
jgi:hypothetical protein